MEKNNLKSEKNNLRYELLYVGNFKKIERVGSFVIERPAAQAVWGDLSSKVDAYKIDAAFRRLRGGDGTWEFFRDLSKQNPLKQKFVLDCFGFKQLVRFTDFGHLGFFPEHEMIWKIMSKQISFLKGKKEEVRVMNLFAYTGSASILAALQGAKVTHVDASKTSVQWARDNFALNVSEEDAKQSGIRWIVEDVQKYCQRELRRGSKFDLIILDPPTYGRGTQKEVWDIQEHLNPLMKLLVKLLDPKFGSIFLSSHTTGYTPIALKQIIRSSDSKLKVLDAGELYVSLPENREVVLPSGAFAVGSF